MQGVGGKPWEGVAIAYKEASKETAIRDGNDVKNHWMKKLCNGMKKPMGKTGENGDRIHECIAIERRILSSLSLAQYSTNFLLLLHCSCPIFQPLPTNS
jgi:hypothetical protein